MPNNQVFGQAGGEAISSGWGLACIRMRVLFTTEYYNRIFTKYLDRSINFVIVLDPIKGSNLRLKICVCSVVSTVETSGVARKW